MIDDLFLFLFKALSIEYPKYIYFHIFNISKNWYFLSPTLRKWPMMRGSSKGPVRGHEVVFIILGNKRYCELPHCRIPYRWKVRRGYVSSVKIFRRLKVSSNRKKIVTFHRTKTFNQFWNFKFFKKYYFWKKIQVHFSHSFIFLFFYHVNVNIYNNLLVVKLYPLVAMSGFRMDNIPVINRLASGMQKKVWLKSFDLKVMRSNLSSGN